MKPLEPDRASASRPPTPLASFSLRYEAPPSTTPGFLWRLEPFLRLRILVVGQFSSHGDPRAVEDRRDVCVSRSTFETCLAMAKLRFAIGDGVRTVEVAIGSLAGFTPAGLQEAAARAGLTGVDAERALVALRARSEFRAVERAWRSLALLVASADEGVDVTFLDISKADLLEDFEDAPEVAKSGFWRIANSYNHPGMAPFGLIVLDHEFDPGQVRDALLLEYLGKMARSSLLPIVAGVAADAVTGADPGSAREATWRATDEAAYVALCAPRFELHRAGDEVLEGSSAFLAAIVVLRGFRRLGWGGPLDDATDEHQLVDPVDAALARRRGWLTFHQHPDGLRIGSASSCRASGVALADTLSATLLWTRIAHMILDLDLRAADRRGRSLAAVVERYEMQLAARFSGVVGLRTRLVDVERLAVGTVHTRLVVTVPTSAPGAA